MKLNFEMAPTSTPTLVPPSPNSPEAEYLDLVDEAQRLMPTLHHDISLACRSAGRMASVIALCKRYKLNSEQMAHLAKLEDFQCRYGS